MLTNLLSTALALIVVGLVFAITWHNVISITAKKEQFKLVRINKITIEMLSRVNTTKLLGLLNLALPS